MNADLAAEERAVNDEIFEMMRSSAADEYGEDSPYYEEFDYDQAMSVQEIIEMREDDVIDDLRNGASRITLKVPSHSEISISRELAEFYVN